MQASTLNNTTVDRPTNRKSDAGFTLLEMVIAISILTVGLLGTAAAIGYGLMASNRGRTITNTKLMVASALEQMETLRDNGNLTFGQIANVGNVDNTGADAAFNGFPATFLPVTADPGPDGIYGTADDLISPGPDGVYGTADDVTDPSRAIVGVQRRITITDLSGTLKRIQVDVTYFTPNGKTAQLTGVSYLNDDAHSNYLP